MPKPKKTKRTYARPLSLFPLTFDQAVDKLLAAKPKKKEPAPKRNKAK